MSVKRYDFDRDLNGYPYGHDPMREAEDGAYVDWGDYEALRANHGELLKAIAGLTVTHGEVKKIISRHSNLYSASGADLSTNTAWKVAIQEWIDSHVGVALANAQKVKAL